MRLLSPLSGRPVSAVLITVTDGTPFPISADSTSLGGVWKLKQLVLRAV